MNGSPQNKYKLHTYMADKKHCPDNFSTKKMTCYCTQEAYAIMTSTTKFQLKNYKIQESIQVHSCTKSVQSCINTLHNNTYI